MAEGSLNLKSLAPNSQVVIVLVGIGLLWALYSMSANQRELIMEIRAFRHDLRAAVRGDIQRQSRPAPGAYNDGEDEDADGEDGEESEGEEGNSSSE